MAVYADVRAYSIQSAAPASGTGSAIDTRSRRGIYAFTFVTGGSAIMTIQASHSIGSDAAWLPVVTVTATNGVGVSSVNTNYYPYVRAQYSGYAGATSTMFIAAGIG